MLPVHSAEKGTSLAFGQQDLPRSTPEAEGIPSSYLRDFFRELDTNPLVCLHGAIVLRHGKVIAEGSWKPYTPSLPHMMFSLSKSVVSMAVGFAVQEGLLRLDEKVVDIFPDRLPLLRNSRMNNVTVEHLLTMTSGVGLTRPVPQWNATGCAVFCSRTALLNRAHSLLTTA